MNYETVGEKLRTADSRQQADSKQLKNNEERKTNTFNHTRYHHTH